MEKCLSLKGVYTSYDKVNDAIIDMDFDVYKGEFVGVIGPSGSGKSTLLKSINLLVSPYKGEVIFEGDSLLMLKKKELQKSRSNIGFIFQEYNLIEESTVIENVLLGNVYNDSLLKVWLKLYSKKDYELALKEIELVGLKHKAFSYARDLSGGEKQRVAIARTLLQSPHIILADEPVSSLDIESSKRVMDTFKEINEKFEIPIIMNVHDVDLAVKYCKRIIGIKHGRKIFDVKKEDLNGELLQTLYKDDKK